MGKNNRKFRKQLRVDAAVDDRESKRFDSLPADIVQVILSYLSGKEAATMATLSKTCQERCPPVLNFDEDNYSCFSTLNLSKRERSFIFDDIVDDTLSKYHPWDGSHRTIRFRTNNSCILKRMDQWLEWARMNKFTDLYLDFRPEYYQLPCSIFASKSLTVLHIKGCRLPTSILNENTRLDTLQELHLAFVSSAGRFIDHLRHICPSIVNLSLIRCTEINDLVLSCLDKLTKVNIEYSTHIDNIVIEAQSLRIFKCRGAVRIIMSRCRNLEVLHLDFYVKGLYPDIFFEMFPFLEELFLRVGTNSSPLKIASPVLHILVLSVVDAGIDIPNLAIDTPNLQYFECTSMSLFRAMTSTPKEIKIRLTSHHLGTSWFFRLRTFLEKQPSKCKKLSIELIFLAVVEFQHKVVRKAHLSSVSPGIKVLNLNVGSSMNSGSYRDLIDGLLWSCHPKTLSVESFDEKSIQAFCNELCNRETKPNCCRPTLKKCWRHYLKHVDMEQLGDSCRRNTLEKREKINFNMTWVTGKK